MATGRGRSRRVSLPGVSELLRPAAVGPDGGDQRQASGREKHTQKITVYLSAEELLDLERARLALLRYGASADRGRIVREAIAVLLADLDARGQESLPPPSTASPTTPPQAAAPRAALPRVPACRDLVRQAATRAGRPLYQRASLPRISLPS